MYKAKVDQKMFDTVKLLLENGATGPEIEKFMKISSWTVSTIRNAESFTEYKNIMAARALAKKEKREKEAKKTAAVAKDVPAEEKPDTTAPQVVEHRQTVAVQTTFYVSQKLDKLCELLTTISAKLAFVVDELTK